MNLAVKRLVQLGLVEEQAWDLRRVVGYSEEVAKVAMEVGLHQIYVPLGEPQPFPVSFRTPILNSIDAHPLVRDYFGSRLRENAAKAWRAAHSRLFGHLLRSVPYWPEDLDGLQSLYQALAHGCKAGRYKQAFEVYHTRTLRGTNGPHAYYSERTLGAIGADLAAVGCFFITPWTRLAPKLTDSEQSFLLHSAALRLRALGRLSEAREPARVSIDGRIEQEKWGQAAASANTLSEIDLTLGDVTSAVYEAQQSVLFADRSGNARQSVLRRATHADALHQAGRAEEARARFEEAEAKQSQWQPHYPLLYSVQGFRFCDLLLADTERAAWCALMERSGFSALSAGDLSLMASNVHPNVVEAFIKPPTTEALRAVEHRTAKALDIVLSGSRLFLDVALNDLTLGRAALYRAILEPSSFERLESELVSHLDDAVDGLRRSGHLDYVPRALLTDACSRAVRNQAAEARADLDEAQQIAERGPMRLHLADVHLHRARLFFRDDLAAAREDLRQARALIEKCGYLRRMPELEDAEKVIFAVK